VDGSVQPYRLVVPAGYDPAKPMWLDVILHGSTAATGISELQFIDAADAGAMPEESFPRTTSSKCIPWAGSARMLSL